MFPIITKKIQNDFQKTIANTEGIPTICGFYGRGCRQMGKTEGANRAICQRCPLAQFASEHKAEPKTLYFEGAGCVARGNVPNCRIRTAFHLDDGRTVYLEISGLETTGGTVPMYRRFKNYGIIDHLHYAHCSSGDDRSDFGLDRTYAFEYTQENILSLVNSLGASFDAIEVLPALAGYRVHADKGGYNFGDEFKKDDELLEARQAIDAQIREKEISRGEKSICYSLWVDSEDPAILHYRNFRTGEKFDICAAPPSNPEKAPALHKSNAVIGAYYGGCGYLLKVYRITEEYAEHYNLMYLDRCEVSSYGDIALPGSDVYRRKGTC